MRRWVWITSIAAGCLMLVLATGLLVVLWAVRQSPAFYDKTLQTDPAQQAKASDEMLQQTTALASEVKRKGRWHAAFSEEQINGWLAVDFRKNHPGLLPDGASDPRIHIQPNELTVACRYQGGSIATVLSLSMDVYLAEPNVVAVRVKRARAGILPLPLDKVLGAISLAAQRMELPLQWKQADGDPVALIRLPPQRAGADKRIHVESLQLGDGGVAVAGSTELSPRQDR